MSSETINPIPPSQFRLAIADLPLDTLHSKAAEIQNSILHLRHSNNEMLPFAEAGDQDCKDAMFENLQVIARMNERISLLREEVEGRGLPWTAAGEEDGEGDMVNGTSAPPQTNGTATATVNGVVSNGEVSAPRAQSGRLTDEELRRQVEAQMMGEEEQEEEGVHL